MRPFNLPGGVLSSDLEGREDFDGMIERLNTTADEAHDRAEDAELNLRSVSALDQSQVDSKENMKS